MIARLFAVKIIRMILVGVVALSVSVLPIAGSAARMASETGLPPSQHASAETAANAKSECCPGHSKPGDVSKDDCAASCALGCFGFVGGVRSVLIIFHSTPRRMAMAADDLYSGAPPTPPFRPPRA